MSGLDDWMDAHPDVQSLRLAICDLNGRARGKRFGRISAEKAASARFPFSALNLDLKGADIEGSPLVFASGDADGVLRPTERGPILMPWLAQPAALLPMTLHHDDGRTFEGDPRHALSAVVDRYAANGWRVEAAFEMEFYLLSATTPELVPLWSGRPGGNTLSVTALDEAEAFFNDLYAGAEAMGLDIGDAISEAGAGQFEVTLTPHRSAGGRRLCLAVPDADRGAGAQARCHRNVRAQTLCRADRHRPSRAFFALGSEKRPQPL